MQEQNGNNVVRVYSNTETGQYETQMVIPLWLTATDAVDPNHPDMMNVNDLIFGLTVDATGVSDAPTLLMTGEARQWARVEPTDFPTVSFLVSSNLSTDVGDL